MNKKLILGISLGTFLIAAGATVAALSFLTPAPQAATEEVAKKPSFSFNSSTTTGWWTSGGSSEDDGAFVSIHHGEGEMKPASDGCFLMYEYKNQPLTNAEQAYTDYEHGKSGTTMGDEVILTTKGTSQQQISTADGISSYELRQYSLDGPSLEKTMHGYMIGFAALPGGQIRIEGVCNTSDDLVGAIDVLPAVSLRFE